MPRTKPSHPLLFLPSVMRALPISRGLSGVTELHGELGPGLTLGGEALTVTVDGARWDRR